MAWVKVDEQFHDHPKVIDVGPLAEAVWFRSLTYAKRQQTDGFVPGGFLRRMGDVDAGAEADRLVAAGLWEIAPGGYRFHDWGEWQTSRAHDEAVSAARREAGSLGGKQKSIKLLAKPDGFASAAGSKPLPDIELDIDLELELEPELETTAPAQTPAAPIDAPARAAPPSPVGSPFALLESLCETLGQDVAVLSEGEKKKQLAAGKRLVAAGMGEADVGRMTRWLTSQSWVTGGIDLFLLEKQLGKWQLAGKPEASPNGRSPTMTKTDQKVAMVLRGRTG